MISKGNNIKIPCSVGMIKVQSIVKQGDISENPLQDITYVTNILTKIQIILAYRKWAICNVFYRKTNEQYSRVSLTISKSEDKAKCMIKWTSPQLSKCQVFILFYFHNRKVLLEFNLWYEEK